MVTCGDLKRRIFYFNACKINKKNTSSDKCWCSESAARLRWFKPSLPQNCRKHDPSQVRRVGVEGSAPWGPHPHACGERSRLGPPTSVATPAPPLPPSLNRSKLRNQKHIGCAVGHLRRCTPTASCAGPKANTPPDRSGLVFPELERRRYSGTS